MGQLCHSVYSTNPIHLWFCRVPSWWLVGIGWPSATLGSQLFAITRQSWQANPECGILWTQLVVSQSNISHSFAVPTGVHSPHMDKVRSFRCCMLLMLTYTPHYTPTCRGLADCVCPITSVSLRASLCLSVSVGWLTPITLVVYKVRSVLVSVSSVSTTDKFIAFPNTGQVFTPVCILHNLFS